MMPSMMPAAEKKVDADWRLPEEFAQHLSDAEGVAERFATGFAPIVERRIQETVQAVMDEEFPALASNNDFVTRVANRLGAEAFEEKPFVFLSRNPAFVQALQEV
jgi:hypothetical protein